MSTDLSCPRKPSAWRHGPLTADWQAAHEMLAADDALWNSAPFAGFQVGGAQLFEMRHCPCCFSTVNRPISFAQALREHAERLAVEQRAGVMLAEWAGAASEGRHG